MRMVALLVTVVLFSGSVLADEIYRRVDGQGRVHYSNGPTRSTDDDTAGEAPADDATVNAPANDDTQARPTADTAFSTEASLQRNALERDLRATDKQLRVLDERLAVLGRARVKHAGGSAATSGVGTLAGDVRSEEEKTLLIQRKQLADHAAEIREAATKLRQDVTERLGATPEWWVEVR